MLYFSSLEHRTLIKPRSFDQTMLSARSKADVIRKTEPVT